MKIVYYWIELLRVHFERSLISTNTTNNNGVTLGVLATIFYLKVYHNLERKRDREVLCK